VTQELIEFLQGSVQETMEAWADELFTGESMEQGALVNAKSLGGVDAFKKLLAHLENFKVIELTAEVHHDTNSY